MGHRTMIEPGHIRLFHAGGFHVVSIDYRLAPETRLPEILEDIKDAWRWLRAEADAIGIDRDRIAVAGHSAGAFLTLASGFRLDPRPAALVAMAGYGKLTHAAFMKPSPTHLQEYALADESQARRRSAQGRSHPAVQSIRCAITRGAACSIFTAASRVSG
jgi:acetyl esterase/lipase